MRYVFRIGFALALGLALMAGCSDENGEGGSGGTAGAGGMAGTGGSGGNGVACVDNVCPCTEAGIRAAIAEGGGPFTFDCDGPTTVVTEAEIAIDKDVVLDGQGNLTIGDEDDAVVFVAEEGVTAELHRLTVTGGRPGQAGGGISNAGTLTLHRLTVTGGGGILNNGTLTMTDCTVFENSCFAIFNRGEITITNSTLSENGRGDCCSILNCDGVMRIISSTVSETMDGGFGSICNGFPAPGDCDIGQLMLMNTVVDTVCEEQLGPVESSGHNLESPGDTCGFDQPTDQVNVSAEQLNLGPLQDNGGPTETHALGAGSVAIDQIPQADCVDADGAPLTTDQRGVARPQGDSCDVGAFELEAAP